jgi:four helix bundle protein
MAKFDALEVSLDVIKGLRGVLPRVYSSDRSLHDQMKRAASSVALNLSEGFRRAGKDRTQFWRIAAGSADELRAALRVAEAWGYLGSKDTAGILDLLDRILAMTWRMTH